MAVVRKRSRDLDKFLSANKRGRLLPSVERYLLTREPEFRDWRALHPSALSKGDVCPRAAWYEVTSETAPPRERVSLVSQNIFDEGHYIHAKWQKRFWGMGSLYGRWRCLVCEHTWWARSPQFCQNMACQSTLLDYIEVPLRNDDWLIAGHADGWIQGIGNDALIEIKSMSSGTFRMEAPNTFDLYCGDFEQMWKDLHRPFVSHLRQAQLYLRILHATRDDAPNEAVFIYESKVNQQVKEFTIPYNESFTDDIVEQAIVVKEAVDAGQPPACPKRGCKQCRSYDKRSA